MMIDEQTIVAQGQVVTWRVGGGKVFATVKDKTVLYDAEWPLDSRRLMAQRLRLSDDYPELRAEIAADFKKVVG
jgi:hypothetical protein